MDIIQIERDIIKGLVKGYGSKILMNRLSIDYFETVQFRKIFQTVFEYFEKFSAVPSCDILINELKKKNVDIDELNNISSFLAKEDSVNEDRFRYAIEEGEKVYLSRRLKVSMKEAIGWIDKGDPKKAQDVLLKDAVDLSSFGRDVTVIDFSENFDDRKKRLINQMQNPDKVKEFCVRTQISELDDELDGGLRRGELGIFLAPPEGGKSISLQDLSVSAMLDGYKVAFVTIEMTPEQTAYRMDSRLTQMKYRKFRRCSLSNDEIIQWENHIKNIQKNSLKIIGVPEGCTCRLIDAELARMKSMFIPDLLVVDYAGIMAPNEGSYMSSMDWKYVGSVVRDLKGLALKLGVPVWTAAQLLVGAKEKSEVSFVDVGLARQQIGAHADVCIAIIQTSQMKLMDETKLQLVKMREGCEKRDLTIISDYDRISLTRKTGFLMNGAEGDEE